MHSAQCTLLMQEGRYR